MKEFTITTRLTTKEYAKVMFAALYKKPVYIFATILGLFMVTTVMLDYLGIINYYRDTPLFEIVCAIILLLAPTLIVFISVNQFTSIPSYQNDMIYTFTNSGVVVQGSTFKNEYLWTHIIKQKELGKFLILYHNKKFGNFIDKKKLTTEQLNFIKLKVGQK